MSKSTTPKYRIVLYARGMTGPMAWNCRTYGNPTAANLDRYIDKYNESLAPGNCNQHIGRDGIAWGGRIETNTARPYTLAEVKSAAVVIPW
jgi:hypothetical protein